MDSRNNRAQWMRLKHGWWGRLAAIAVIVFSFQVNGAQESTSTTQVEKPPEKKSPSISGNFLLQTAGTLNQAGDKMASGLYLLSGSYKIPTEDGSISFGGSIGYQRMYTYEGAATQTLFAAQMPENRNWDWVDPRLSVARTQKEVLGVESISYGLGTTIAGLSYASERKSQAFAIGPNFKWTNNVGAFWGKPGRLTLTQAWSYRYVHHHYKTTNSGGINAPHSFLLSNVFDYSLGSRSSVSMNLGYAGGISYQDVVKSGFAGGIEFAYTLSDELATSLGFSNDTTGYAADGQTRELNFMNPDSATFYFNLDITI